MINNENTPNERQIEAINSNGNVIVIAGAGAGKTKTFTDRFLKISKNIDISRILALTFSDKASNSLKEKINKDYMPHIGTFHSVFYKLLNNFNYLKDYNTENEEIGNIYEESRYNYYLENSFSNDILTNKEFKLKVNSIKKVNEFINENLEVALTSDTYRDYVLALNEIFIDKFNYSETNNIIEEFLFQKKQDRVLNFDDIIIETYFFIKEHKEAREYLRNYFLEIMVDEFQDTNMIVLDIIAMLENDNCFMVGDSLQSIYSFQGADYSHINNLIDKCENLIQLDINYRSSENIVNMANDFIDSSLNKSDKIKAVRDNGERKNNSIRVIENITDYTIPELIKNSKYDLEEICILSRNNNHIEEVKDILEKHNIPYNKGSYGEIEHILNTMLVMITNDYKATNSYYDRFNIEEWLEIINNSKKDYITDYIMIIEKIWKSEDLANYFQNRNYKDIHKVVNLWIDKKAKSFNFDTELLLENIEARVELYLEKKTYIKKFGVNLSTIHKAKGLEWEEVILYNQEDNEFPKDIKSQEEARLYYVAITRPKESLIITSKNDINIYTKRLLENDYIEHTKYKREKELEIDIDNREEDIIDFRGNNTTVFYELDLEKIKKYNSKKIITKYIETTNKMIQDNKIKNINVYDIEDIEIMLLELEELKAEFEIDFIPLKEMFLQLELDKKIFFSEEKINYNYINNDFTKEIHNIINYRNLMTFEELNEEAISNNQFIRKFGKIVKKFVSKKHTDLTKDRSKKSLEIQQRKLNNKDSLNKLDSLEDHIFYLKQEYIKNSDKQKKHYNENILGLYDTLNNRKMTDFESDMNKKKLEETLIDYDKRGNKYYYTKETLSTKFLNDKNRIQAMKIWSKVKYIEYKSRGLKGAFLTLTNLGKYHKWKMTKEAIKDKSLRVYGNTEILELNPNFEMRGDNYIEHIKIVGKELKAIYTVFYSRLKSKITKYEIKNKYEEGHFKLRQFKNDEPHKNLMLHEHSLIYLKEEVYHFIEETFNEVIADYGLNPEFQDIVDFEKKEDTERGRNLLRQNELEDKIIIMENENEIIKEYIDLKYSYDNFEKRVNILLLNIKLDTKLEIKRKIREIKKTDIYKEYRILKEEFNIYKEKVEEIDKPQIEIREKMFNEMIEETDTEKRNKLLNDINDFDKKCFRERAEVSSYVAKYIMKGAFSEENDTEQNLDEIIFYNMWKNILGSEIRITNITNYDYTTQKHIDKMYLWYQEHAPEKLEYLNSLNKPLYVSLEELEMNGSFKFDYERKVKENFKNSDYIRDIETIYQELKLENTDTDIKELWTIATNEVLKSENNYLNIHTDKKLIGFYVKEEFIRENTLSEEELYSKFEDLMIEKPYENWLSIEEEVEIELENRYSNIIEIKGVNYKTIYIEDMYIKDNITIEELLQFYNGDIEAAKERYVGFYNHKDTVEEEMRVAFNPPPDFLIF